MEAAADPRSLQKRSRLHVLRQKGKKIITSHIAECVSVSETDTERERELDGERERN